MHAVSKITFDVSGNGYCNVLRRGASENPVVAVWVRVLSTVFSIDSIIRPVARCLYVRTVIEHLAYPPVRLIAVDC